MKNLIISLLAICSMGYMQAQDLKPIQLNAPTPKGGLTVMEAFAQRQSTRSFTEKELSTQELSDLLWAANGINRPDKGMRTAPSALNYQDIDIYVCKKEGAYLYNAKTNKLEPIIAEDLRGWVAGQQAFVKSAPVVLVLVSDLSKMRGGNTESNRMIGAMDAGIVSENISIACAGLGFVTVPRASMDKEELSRTLQLKDSQILLLNHPVGKK